MFNKFKGVTITELLVTIAVMGLMFSMILAIMVLLKRSYSEEDSRSAMQQNAAVALAKLTRELMESSYKTTTIYNPSSSSPPTGIIFASARQISNYNKFDLDPNNSLCVWHKYVCYYIDTDPERASQKALFRRETYINEPSGTTTKGASSLSTSNFVTGGTGYSPAIVIAHRVEDLDFPDLGVGNFGPAQIGNVLPLKVSLKIAEKSATQNYNAVTLTFTMNMNN
ncbi:MAG: hypothetical protein ABRQ39_04185 [Candidatus Eremiobacterota bacterium]